MSNEAIGQTLADEKPATNTTIEPIAGYPVQALRSNQLIDRLLSACEAGRQCAVFFANTNFVVKCQELRSSLLSQDVILVNDGVGMDLANLLLRGRRFPENLNGTDFVPLLLKESLTRRGRSLRVFLFGGKPGVADRAAHALTSMNITVCGTCDGYQSNDDQLIEAINQARADVVLVAKGNPLQEQWILDHRHRLTARLLIGVGALLDFLAGDKPRAPVVVQRCRLEWLYRLCLEPKRLMRRYTVDVFVFFSRCLLDRRCS